jgi:DNA mismatch repair protein MutS
MCGIPFHSSEAYIQRLLEKGYKVAICEQTELPQKGKTLVNRDVIRVVTPGTIMENSMLSEDKNNYIASIYIDNNQASICFCDISTGSMQSTVVGNDNFENNLKSEIFKYMPKEIIINTPILKLKWLTDYLKNIVHCSVELIDDAEYNDFVVDETVRSQFKGKTFSIEMSRCLWQLINYLSQTQKVGIEKLDAVENWRMTNDGIEVKGQNGFVPISKLSVAQLQVIVKMRKFADVKADIEREIANR